MKKTKGTLLLFLTALIWGTAFVAQSAAADSIGAFTFTAARSLIASVFLGLLLLIRRNKAQDAREVSGKRTIICGLICGVVFFLASNFQQFGIAAYPDGVAASGRSGFLTATYVVMVALCARFSGKKLHPIMWAATFGCIAGMYLLCMSEGFSGIYLGDVLVFLCAVCFTAHILVIDRYSYIDSIKLSFMQFTVCGLLSLIGALIFEHPTVSQFNDAWFCILYAGVFSSGIAYTLQMAGQKYAEPSVASIVLSLESVFAALAGWVILDERLSGKEIIGCVLVFGAVILAQVPSFIKQKTNV